MASKKILYNRRFLNEEEGTAFIETEVRVDPEGYPSMLASLTLSDCSRQITLDFSYDTLGDADTLFNSRLRKINNLLNDLHAFRDALIAAKKPYTAALERYKAERKNKKDEPQFKTVRLEDL